MHFETILLASKLIKLFTREMFEMYKINITNVEVNSS